MSFRIVMAETYEELMSLMEGREEDEELLIVNTNVMGPQDFITGVVDAEVCASDFDGTAAQGSQFELIGHNLLRDDLHRADRADAQAYFGGGMPTDYGNIAFIMRTVGRMVESGVDFERFAALVAKSPPREGAYELAESFAGDEGERRFAVISYGLADWIYEWLGLHWDYASKSVVFALELLWSEGPSMRLMGADIPSVVCDGNKGFKLAIFCAINGVDPSRALVVGDSPLTDLTMLTVPGALGVLLIPDTEKAMTKEEGDMRKCHRAGGPLKKAFEAGVPAFLLPDTLMPLVKIREGRVAA